MKICDHCGEQFSDERILCPRCGGHLSDISQEFFCPTCKKSLGKSFGTSCPYCGQSFVNSSQSLSSNVSKRPDTEIFYRTEAEEEEFQKRWAQKEAMKKGQEIADSIGFIVIIGAVIYFIAKHL